MRFTVDIKAFCLHAMIGCVVLSSNAIASSVEILVDAALDQESLQVASEVALNVARAAGDENSVGMVVYDEVFQRSTENTVADEVHVERISQLFESIVPTEFSNIAVGIEKGISELNTGGGVLLVFGNGRILLADDESAAKYSDWLKLVLLPDAASKSITTILAIPQNAQSSALDSIIQKFPDNRVISYSDTSDALGQLSTILPFQLPQITPTAGATSTPIQPAPEAVVTPPPASAVTTEQSGGMRPEHVVLLALLALLFFVVVAITICILKRKREGKHELSGDAQPPAEKPTPCRYLAPKRGVATVATTRVAEADEKPTMAEPKTRASHRSSDSDQSDESATTGSELTREHLKSELDVTAPRRPVKSDATTKIAGPDSTMRRVTISHDDSKMALGAVAIDELEELRNVTHLKHEILN